MNLFELDKSFFVGFAFALFSQHILFSFRRVSLIVSSICIVAVFLKMMEFNLLALIFKWLVGFLFSESDSELAVYDNGPSRAQVARWRQSNNITVIYKWLITLLSNC